MLSDLKTGEKCVICNLDSVNGLVKRRLKDLGVTKGTEVCVKCIMPMGGPFMLETKGQSVAIRRKEVSLIEVERA